MKKLTNKEKMLKGLLYLANDKELVKMSNNARDLLDEFNGTFHRDFKKRTKIAEKLFKSIGKNIKLNKPLYVDYGCNITIGDNFYANFNLTMLDVNTITIGNNVMFAPNVSLYTASHPIDPEVRNMGPEFGLPIVIGDNVWIGGNTSINPGVKIGNNSIIGTGSVVTTDIPDNVIAFGNPAKVFRKITEEDKIYWKKRLSSEIK